MKKKNLLLTAVATLGLTAATMAQNNCDLINSVTLNVPGSQTLGGITYGGPNGVVSQWSNCNLTTQNWNYVAYTKDANNNYSFYINGNLVKTGSYQNLPYNWTSLRLGTDLPTSPNSFFNGKIDELKISNIVRTGTEISQYYTQNTTFTADLNTIGLYNFDQGSGSTINGTAGPIGTGYNTTFSTGVYNNAISFNGINSYADFQLNVPEQNITVEFWVYINNIQGASDWIINYPGLYGAGFECLNYTPSYSWSTGATGNSVTVNPTQMPFVWVTDGNCTDTVWFNSQSATIYDTTFITVTDTLLINTNVTGINPPNNTNTIKVFPNPASTHITIDYGNFAIMNGYQLVIENSIGQQVFQTNITQQSDYLSLSTWGGNGLYFVHIIDPQGNTIDIRKIVLQ